MYGNQLTWICDELNCKASGGTPLGVHGVKIKNQKEILELYDYLVMGKKCYCKRHTKKHLKDIIQ